MFKKKEKKEKREPPPEVTGLRPTFGPTTGGTVLLLRGANFGRSVEDIVSISIAGYAVEEVGWDSPSKLRCMTPPGAGAGPIIVTTRLGGKGTCTVEFYYEQVVEKEPEDVEIDLFTEVDVWTEEIEVKPKSAAEIQTGHSEDDPLRLGKTSRKRAPPGSKPTGGPLENLAAALKNPKASGLLSSPDFDPVWCLVEAYQKTSFDQFKEGVKHLSGTVTEQGRESRDMIINSSGVFISCFETLTEARDLIGKHRALSATGDPTHSFETVLRRLLDLSDAAFEPLLSRRRQANKARNVLRVLTNYQFLFHLPKTLKENIVAQRWGQVIQDYKKAKSLFANTQIAVFARVLEQIENLSDEVRRILFAKLDEQPSTLQAEMRTIGLLADLGVDHDPGWYCLGQQNAYLQNELATAEKTLRDTFEASAVQVGKGKWGKVRGMMQGSFHGGASGGGGGGGGHRRGALLSTTSASTLSSLASTSSLSKPRLSDLTRALMRDLGTSKTAAPQLVFVTRVTRALTEQLPSMWRLGQLCLARSLPDQRSETLGAMEAYLRQEVDPADAQALTQQLSDMVTAAVTAVVAHCRAVFIERVDNEPKPSLEAMTKSEALIRACHTTLSALELPVTAIASLSALLADFRRHTIVQLFQTASEEISQLGSDEDWKASNHGVHTHLPEKFYSALQAAFGVILEMKHNSRKHEAVEGAETMLCDAFQAFTTVLAELAFPSDVGAEGEQNAHNSEDALPQKRLLCVMANCLYTRRVIGRRVATEFHLLAIGDLSQQFENTLIELDNLERQCFDQLLEVFSGKFAILDAITDDGSLLLARPQVRPYAQSLLLSLVAVHSTVVTVARPFVRRVLSTLLNHVAVHMMARVNQAPNFVADQRAVLHALLEVTALKHVFRRYDSTPSVWEPLFALLQSKSIGAVAGSDDNVGPLKASPAAAVSAAAAPATKPAGGRVLPTPGAVLKKGPSASDGAVMLSGPAGGAGVATAAAGTSHVAERELELLSVTDAPELLRVPLQRFLQHNRFQLLCFTAAPENEADFFVPRVPRAPSSSSSSSSANTSASALPAGAAAASAPTVVGAPAAVKKDKDVGRPTAAAATTTTTGLLGRAPLGLSSGKTAAATATSVQAIASMASSSRVGVSGERRIAAGPATAGAPKRVLPGTKKI